MSDQQQTPNAQRPTPNGEWVEVPNEIAKCPECGAPLRACIDGWTEGKGYSVQLDCSRDEEQWHECCQGDWQPIIDAVTAWTNVRKHVSTLSNGLKLYQVQLVGGSFDGSTSICSHEVCWKNRERYVRGADDRYHYTPEGAGKN